MSVLAVAAAGVLLGLRYKAAALIAATTVMVLAILAWNGVGLSPSVALSSLVVLVLALQSGYIIGVWLAIAWRRRAETRR
jgi:preprotein translocase subunit SecF